MPPDVVSFTKAADRLKAAAEAERPPEFSDDALALLFAEDHADLRYVAAWGQWSEWGGNIWREDSTLAVFDHARTTARDAAAACKEPKAVASIKSAKTAAAIERLARADRRIAATVEQWDNGTTLINPKRMQ
jgi:putative DNA primase/helicase